MTAEVIDVRNEAKKEGLVHKLNLQKKYVRKESLNFKLTEDFYTRFNFL
jgi:hypothetical protein